MNGPTRAPRAHSRTAAPEHTLLLTPDEAAVELRVGHTKLWELMACGEVPHIRVGRRRRIRRSDLVAYCQSLAEGDGVGA
jgi:excisionase family DNA binding protein